MPYDKSFTAVFKPGTMGDFFPLKHSIEFQPQLNDFSLANAWWLAEFCRLVYHIDDLLQQGDDYSNDVADILAGFGCTIRTVINDASSSTCVALFDFPSQNEHAQSAQLVVFCGSNEALDWKTNLQAAQSDYPGGGRVHRGFLASLQSVAGELTNLLKTVNSPVLLAGHSLGAALATLMTVELTDQGLPIKSCYSFGSPRIGDAAFVERLVALPIYRIVNNCDVVTGLPMSLGANEYVHSNPALFFDQKGERVEQLTDLEIQRRQSRYLPGLARYLDSELLLGRLENISRELPLYIADHGIGNYAFKIALQVLD